MKLADVNEIKEGTRLLVWDKRDVDSFFSVILTSNLRKERYRSYYQFTCHVSYSGLTFTTRRKDYLKGCLLFYIPEVYDYYLLEREDMIEI